MKIKHLFILSLCLLSYSFVWGQKNSNECDDYTCKWYKTLLQKTKLKNLKEAKDSVCIRIADNSRIIDIQSNDFVHFEGTMTQFTHRKGKKKERLYSKKIKIGDKESQMIYQIFSELKINDVPMGDSIKSWRNGVDGETYIIEYATTHLYTYKTYWTPSIWKDKIKEAATIYDFTERINKIIDKKNLFNAFLESLPKGCYTNGIFVRCLE